uniref:Uncharacterized protein n=1 Tax=Hyaloperonospora arabidopsidis (strain Emoy2) TaxID=559515 RepID=M4BKK9_HYAAE
MPPKASTKTPSTLHEPYEDHTYADLRRAASARCLHLPRTGPYRVANRANFIALLRANDKATRATRSAAAPLTLPRPSRPSDPRDLHVVRTRRSCRFRLLNVLLSRAFIDRWDAMKTSNGTLEMTSLWLDVHAAFRQRKRSPELDVLLFDDALFKDVTPHVVVAHSASRLVEMWMDIVTLYRDAVAQAEAATAVDAAGGKGDSMHSFVDFCAGRLDLLYLHMAMLLEPKLYEFLLSDKLVLADGDGSSRIKVETPGHGGMVDAAHGKTDDAWSGTKVPARSPAKSLVDEAKTALASTRTSPEIKSSAADVAKAAPATATPAPLATASASSAATSTPATATPAATEAAAAVPASTPAAVVAAATTSTVAASTPAAATATPEIASTPAVKTAATTAPAVYASTLTPVVAGVDVSTVAASGSDAGAFPSKSAPISRPCKIPTQNPEMDEFSPLANLLLNAVPTKTAAVRTASTVAKANRQTSESSALKSLARKKLQTVGNGKTLNRGAGAQSARGSKSKALPPKQKQTESRSEASALSMRVQSKSPVGVKCLDATTSSLGKRPREGSATAIVKVSSVSDIVPHSGKQAHSAKAFSTALAGRAVDVVLPPDEWDILESRLRKVNENIDRCHRGLTSVDANVNGNYKQSLEADLRFYSAIKQRLQEQLLVVMQSGY